MKRTIAVLCAVLMLAAFSCSAFAESSGTGVESGQTMPDFTVSLYDGTTATLSELLNEKDLVVLNVFATWCQPCEREFPEMEKSYQAHSDRMEILSVSGYSDDTMEMIADYRTGHALTFPMGLAGDALGFLNVPGYPTTFFIGRESKILFIKVGAFLIDGEFEEKVATFLSPDYDGKPLPSEIAHSYFLQFLAAIVVIVVLLVIGRWLLLRKAGKPGWQSLIPFLSIYREYALCWKGWVGILTGLLPIAAIAVNVRAANNGTFLASVFLLAAYVVLRVIESVKLSKAFGKGAGIGILLAVFQSLGRVVLGVSKTNYQGSKA